MVDVRRQGRLAQPRRFQRRPRTTASAASRALRRRPAGDPRHQGRRPQGADQHHGDERQPARAADIAADRRGLRRRHLGGLLPRARRARRGHRARSPRQSTRTSATSCSTPRTTASSCAPSRHRSSAAWCTPGAGGRARATALVRPSCPAGSSTCSGQGASAARPPTPRPPATARASSSSPRRRGLPGRLPPAGAGLGARPAARRHLPRPPRLSIRAAEFSGRCGRASTPTCAAARGPGPTPPAATRSPRTPPASTGPPGAGRAVCSCSERAGVPPGCRAGWPPPRRRSRRRRRGRGSSPYRPTGTGSHHAGPARDAKPDAYTRRRDATRRKHKGAGRETPSATVVAMSTPLMPLAEAADQIDYASTAFVILCASLVLLHDDPRPGALLRRHDADQVRPQHDDDVASAPWASSASSTSSTATRCRSAPRTSPASSANPFQHFGLQRHLRLRWSTRSARGLRRHPRARLRRASS